MQPQTDTLSNTTFWQWFDGLPREWRDRINNAATKRECVASAYQAWNELQVSSQ